MIVASIPLIFCSMFKTILYIIFFLNNLEHLQNWQPTFSTSQDYLCQPVYILADIHVIAYHGTKALTREGIPWSTIYFFTNNLEHLQNWQPTFSTSQDYLCQPVYILADIHVIAYHGTKALTRKGIPWSPIFHTRPGNCYSLYCGRNDKYYLPASLSYMVKKIK